MADTAALVVALSAQLTKFEKDMQKAGIMAEKAVGDIESKFSKVNIGVGAGIGSFLGTLAGSAMSTAISELSKLYSRFKDIDETAKLAAISMNAVFGFQTALGGNYEAVDKALVSLSALLDKAKRGEDNALSKIFQVNDVALSSIKNSGDALLKVSDIISRLTPIQGKLLLEGLGIDPRLLEDLRKGEEHIRKIQQTAQDAAPDLKRLSDQAKEFDTLWKAAADAFKGYMSQAFDAALESTRQFMRNTANELKAIESLSNSIRESVGITGKTGMAGQAAEGLERMADPNFGKPPKRIEILAPRQPAKPLPVGGGSTAAAQRDEFERANDQITKNIALLDAQTKTMFMNVGAQAAARAEAQLMEAERRRLNIAEGEAVPISEELRKKIDAQAAAMSRATLENAKAAQQLQRINQAYDTFGSAVSTAFADAIIEGKKLNEVLSSLLKTLARAAINSTITGLFNSFKPGAFAGGTDYAPGGMALVGERGPELVNLPRGSQVIPNDVLRGGMSGGGSITYAPAIDARGASVEAVARLAQIIEQDRAMFASRTVATIQQARRGRVPGL